jgi:hypothetical protein
MGCYLWNFWHFLSVVKYLIFLYIFIESCRFCLIDKW